MPKVTTKSTKSNRAPATKAERRGMPKPKREASRVKAKHPPTAIATVTESSSSKRATATAGPSTKPPRVIARTSIDDDIVLLHCECNYNSETIYLQYRDGNPLPRPNVVGFELIDRLIRSPVCWTGFGTPYVYQASVMKRGSYALKYKGREVWSYGQDDLAEMEKEYEEAKEVNYCRACRTVHDPDVVKTPEDLERWDKFMAFYTEKMKTIRVMQEDRVLARFGDDMIAFDDPDEDFYPEEFYVRCDTELTREWREYKERTGKAMRYGPMPVVRT